MAEEGALSTGEDDLCVGALAFSFARFAPSRVGAANMAKIVQLKRGEAPPRSGKSVLVLVDELDGLIELERDGVTFHCSLSSMGETLDMASDHADSENLDAVYVRMG